MAFPDNSSCTLTSSVSWQRLVTRSIEASRTLRDASATQMHMVIGAFEHYGSLDGFLTKAPTGLMFWFFQRRDAFLSQKQMTKWSPDSLDNYVLLPAAAGFVSRAECFFVSHYWLRQDHPDPEGEYLRLLQAQLQPQSWSYIWVDWSCLPQSPRTQAEEVYFLRSLETMSGIIRNSGFIWFYQPWEPRMWILYEVAESTLTASTEFEITPDIKDFKDHISEMVQTSVQSVLNKYHYTCTDDRDIAYLTSWLELLVLLRRLHIDIIYIRRIVDSLTWCPTARDFHHLVAEDVYVGTPVARLHLCKYEGTVTYKNEQYSFKPFPKWEDGKYSANRFDFS